MTQLAGAILSSSLLTQCLRPFFELQSVWCIVFWSYLLLLGWCSSQSGGWGLEYPHSCPQFCRSIKNSNSTQFIELYFGVLKQIKPLQPNGQAAEFKFESKFKPLQVIWQSLPKVVPEDNRRFRGQNQWPSPWGRALARLAQVGQASTNTRHFRVCGSRCGQRPARLRKTYYHSCFTDLVRELKSF